MEISLLPKNSIRIKGKNATIIVDPQEKIEANAGLIFSISADSANTSAAEVIIEGPGEYETGGIKISSTRYDGELVFSLNVDSVSVMVGKAAVLEKVHQKLKEANILVVKCDDVSETTSLTSLVSNVIMFYGEKAIEVGKSYGSENVKHLPKYSSTFDKLPAEVETIILE